MKAKDLSTGISTSKINSESKYTYAFCGIITLLIAAAYSNTIHVPIIFDDYATLVENTHIHSLSSFIDLISPPLNRGLGWRPFANISFALSYALSGLDPWAHHLFSIAIHSCAALALFFVIKETLKAKPLDHLFNKDATMVAGFIAIIWAIHPVQTQTITYISQRTEALMGMMYLITLYTFIRGTKINDTRWYILSVTCCTLGIMSKEVMITAPVVILVYDRTFLAGTFKDALKLRRKIYASLCLSWIPFFLILKTIKRQAVGYGMGVTWYTYALTECKAVITYLRLCIWPNPLVFDRGAHFLHTAYEAIPYALPLGLLLIATVYTLIRKPTLGFLGAWFFIILSPTSSVVPVAEVPIAENRIYLPLVAVVCLIVTGIYFFLGKKTLIILCPIIIISCLLITTLRNTDYISSISIWKDTVAKDPTNTRALNNLGYLMLNQKEQRKEAESYFREAIRLRPHYSDALTNLGMVLADDPTKQNEAIKDYLEAIKYSETNAEAHSCYANLIAKIPGKKQEAIHHLLVAIDLKPYSSEFHNNYAAIIADDPTKRQEAISEYKKSLALNPNYAEAHNNLANLYATIEGKELEAISEYRKAIQCNPSLSFVHFNLGLVLKQNPKFRQQALDEFSLALSLNPSDSASQIAIIHCNKGLVFESDSNYIAAINEYQTALKIYPAIPQAYIQLAGIYQKLGNHYNDIILCFEKALKLDPESFEIHSLFANYLYARDPKRAIIEFREMLKLKPDSLPVKEALKNLEK